MLGVGVSPSILLWEQPWSASVSDGGLVSLPWWLSYDCATAGTTSQQSASTVQSGYAANAPRAFSADGVAVGVLVEPSTTNLVGEPHRPSLWSSTAGTPAETTVTGPEGGTAYRYEDDDAGAVESHADVDALGVLSGTFSVSAWLADVTSTRCDVRVNEDGGLIVMTGGSVLGPSSGWAYVSAAYSATAPTTACEIKLFPAAAGTSDTGAASVWGIQVEDGRVYPTSFVDGSRAAGHLIADGDVVSPGGDLGIAVTFVPLFAHDEVSGEVPILYRDDDNRVYYDGAAGNFVLVVGGFEFLAAATFGRHQALTLTVTLSRGIVLSGATTGDGETLIPPGQTWPAGDVYVGSSPGDWTVGGIAVVSARRATTPAPLYWEASAPVDGELLLPSFLSYDCATANTTSQQSASTVQSGYAANAPRAFSVDGVEIGLLVEPSTTNRVPEPHRPSLWSFTAGTPAETTVTGPDGGTAYRYEDDDAGAVEFHADVDALGVLSGTFSVSAWVADVTSAQARVIASEGAGGIGAMVSVIVDGPTIGWAYVSGAYSATAPTTSCEIEFRPAFTVADTGAASACGIQVEDGRMYPTSFIEEYRAAGHLTADLSVVTDGGRFVLGVGYIPLFAHDEVSGEVNILYVDDDNRVYYDGATAEMVVASDGSEARSPLTFSRHDQLNVLATISEDSAIITVGGAATGGMSASFSAPAAWPSSGTLYVGSAPGDWTVGGGAIAFFGDFS